MRKVSALLILSSWVLLIFPARAENPPYPAPTPLVSSSFFSHVLMDTQTGDTGGALELSLGIKQLWKDYGISLQGLYSWFPRGDSETIPFLEADIMLQYNRQLLQGLRIEPLAGMGLTKAPGSDDDSSRAVIKGGVNMSLHLHDRQFLYLKSTVSFPFHQQLTPWVTLGLGYGRERPYLPVIKPAGLQSLPEVDRFSPDGDGEQDLYSLKIDLKHPQSVIRWTIQIFDPQDVLFYQTSGSGRPPERFIWNGRSSRGEWVSSAVDYHLCIETTDKLGNVESNRHNLRTDILVIKDGEKLKIRIPSIMFAPDSSDLVLLGEPEISGNNKMILERLYEIFQKFPEYRIQIEGHANNLVTRSESLRQKEEEKVLIPLSLSRAESVKEGLVELGIEEDRISCKGMGGSIALFPLEDSANIWKNRRVEFILLK